MTGGNYTYQGEHFIMYIIVKSLHAQLEASIIFYVNYKKKKDSQSP